MNTPASGHALVLAALVAGLLPVLACQPAPFVDWPNHLARVFIDVELVRGNPFWSHYYSINPHPVPNEALDFVVGALHWAGLSIDLAGTLFLAGTYVMFVGGFYLLARALGSPGPARPLIAALLFSTGPLMYGLVNYVFGLGLAMGLLAAWLPSPPRRRWMIAIGGTVLLFYVHLLAAALWVLVAGCVELRGARAAMREGVSSVLRNVSSVSAGCIFLTLLLLSSTAADSLPDANGSNIFYMGRGSAAGVLRWKVALFVRLFTDHAGVAVGILTWAVVALLAIMAGRSARLRMRASVLAALGLLIVAVMLLPESAGTGSLLDYRLALPIALLAAAGLQVTWRSPRARTAALALLVALLVVRSMALAAAFSSEASVYRAFDAVARTLPPGSIMLTARGKADPDIPLDAWWGPPMEHVSARAVFQGLVVPTVFAVQSQQPIVLRRLLEPWRNEWRIATSDEFNAMVEDLRPLCGVASAQSIEVFLFVAYPGPAVERADPSTLIVATPAFRILNACLLDRAVGFARDFRSFP
ncbi:MAG TPA: hypothetical protein VHS58_00585 [Acetobacteraceae bacterium]|nr:hypothetical protein [Acetobacteraceae bacterium]